ncbi:acyl carrier protein [Pseudomonas sp. NPDC090202]|uniref:acyl carrier protein n=1 Tax=unclassified Pseudomonas TaxID=196821 RepID=UPI003828A103
MTRDEVAKKVKEVVADQLACDFSQVTENARFIDDLGADSLDLAELPMAVEEAFGIQFREDEAEKIQTVKQAIDLIYLKVK